MPAVLRAKEAILRNSCGNNDTRGSWQELRTLKIATFQILGYLPREILPRGMRKWGIRFAAACLEVGDG